MAVDGGGTVRLDRCKEEGLNRTQRDERMQEDEYISEHEVVESRIIKPRAVGVLWG